MEPTTLELGLSCGSACVQKASDALLSLSFQVSPDQGALMLVDPAGGTIREIHRFPMSGPQENIGETASAIYTGERIYLLERERAGRYRVSHVAENGSTVLLPRVPPPYDPTGMIESFWADPRGVVYLNLGEASNGLELVAIDWSGQLTWSLGVSEHFPGCAFNFYGHNLTEVADRGFLIYFEAIDLADPDSQETIGLVEVSASGDVLSAQALKRDDFTIPDFPFLDGGAGVQVGGAAALHWSLSRQDGEEQALMLCTFNGHDRHIQCLGKFAVPDDAGIQLRGAASLASGLAVGHGSRISTYRELGP